ncbi:MAG: hypothetical protein RBQ97_09720 [Acholeplasma sp.]|nr:hypothetical protein [Acholeplasma sp.]
MLFYQKRSIDNPSVVFMQNVQETLSNLIKTCGIIGQDTIFRVEDVTHGFVSVKLESSASIGIKGTKSDKK